ncbi:MAG TPA: cell division protein FtsX [Cytophagales bacterium]|nr:cell division protein FtsX [Cytophagales bacterium]
MIRNYIKVAFRNLWKYKFYSAINVLGLSIGIASVLLMVLYVQHELSYDQYYEDADRIYRVDFSGTMAGQDFAVAVVSPHAGPTFLEEYPEVEDYARFRNQGSWIIDYEGEKYREDGGVLIFADQGVARMFDFEFLAGNPEDALEEPNKLVLTETIAKKYFGDADPMGKILNLDNSEDYEVTGVIKDIPGNTHFNFGIFASLLSLDETTESLWLSNNFQTYIKLREGANPADVEAKFPGTIQKYFGPELEQFMGKSIESWIEEGNNAKWSLMPVTHIHLDSNIDVELGINGDRQYVYIFSAVAILILFIACINFMNLSTARSANRAKEVGIRKTMGSLKKQLVTQFLSEAFVLSMVAFLIAMMLAGLALGQFNQLAGKELTVSTIHWPTMLPILLGIALFIGLMAGSYPAFYLSGFNPVTVLKGKLQGGMKHKGLRSTLVVFQFSISIILIVCTLVVYQQRQYMSNQNLGYDKEQLVSVMNAYLLGDNTNNFKEEVMRDPSFLSATVTGHLPTPSSSNNSLVFPGTSPDDERATSMRIIDADFDYVKTLGFNVKLGRDFDPSLSTDSTAVLLNEACMKQFNWTEENVLDQQVGMFAGRQGQLDQMQVIGVVEDFFFESMRTEISPAIIRIGRNRGRITFKIAPEKTGQALATLESTWKEISNGQPYAYEFVDESFEAQYESEKRQGAIFNRFAVLAILIACLGLFGLAAFTAEQRTKEIGVRKVLGASVSGLVIMLSKEFMILVSISFVIGSLVAGYIMNEYWLNDFTYRTNLSPWVFAIAGGTALLVAWLTMSFQSIRAALANPVQSLRSE